MCLRGSFPSLIGCAWSGHLKQELPTRTTLEIIGCAMSLKIKNSAATRFLWLLERTGKFFLRQIGEASSIVAHETAQQKHESKGAVAAEAKSENVKKLLNDPDFNIDEKIQYWIRQRFILTDLVQDYLRSHSMRMIVLDAGAREAHADPRWRGFDADCISFIGFEVDADEAGKLSGKAQEVGIDARYYPFGLWSKDCSLTVYETKSPGGSSVYEPNSDVTYRWKFQNEQISFSGQDVMAVANTYVADVKALDTLGRLEAQAFDFMKLNVQGGELEILKGGIKSLEGVLGILTEVSFVESYKERPFFSDVDAFLRSNGFAFFDLVGLHYMGRSRSRITAKQLPGLVGLPGQLIEAHGLYFRDPIALAAVASPQLKDFDLSKLLKLVALAETFHQIEYAFELLDWGATYYAGLGQGEAADVIQKIASKAEKKYLFYMSWHEDGLEKYKLHATRLRLQRDQSSS